MAFYPFLYAYNHQAFSSIGKADHGLDKDFHHILEGVFPLLKVQLLALKIIGNMVFQLVQQSRDIIDLKPSRRILVTLVVS